MRATAKRQLLKVLNCRDIAAIKSLISDRAQQILLTQVPQKHQASFETQLETFSVSDPVTTIEQ
ncbi:MAG: hypothetical protein V7K25_31140 [Nostoc sp.]|uniref:hypothetical protein n=1 Tax=Nostoc sp. TaxID=1180 RepID=UPI002FF4886C